MVAVTPGSIPSMIPALTWPRQMSLSWPHLHWPSLAACPVRASDHDLKIFDLRNIDLKNIDVKSLAGAVRATLAEQLDEQLTASAHALLQVTGGPSHHSRPRQQPRRSRYLIAPKDPVRLGLVASLARSRIFSWRVQASLVPSTAA